MIAQNFIDVTCRFANSAQSLRRRRWLCQRILFHACKTLDMLQHGDKCFAEFSAFQMLLEFVYQARWGCQITLKDHRQLEYSLHLTYHC